MIIVNEKMYNCKNIGSFIDASIQCVINDIPDLIAKKEYWLYYFIKQDFNANMLSLHNVDVSTDFLGFPMIRKNTRHAIEAFFDLYNLCNDSEYIEVLKYCAKKSCNIENYKKYLYGKQFTIESKYKMMNNIELQSLLEISKECNAFVHPNVFVNVLSVTDWKNKENILKELLHANVFMLDQAYGLLLKLFFQNKQPILGCQNCIMGRQCVVCHKQEYDSYMNCINNELFIEIREDARWNYYNK